MKLKVLLPTKVLLEQPVSKIIAEAVNGSFCIKPKHIDYVSALVPGIVRYQPVGPPDSPEMFLAVDHGMLLKCGPNVTISVRRGVIGDDLSALRHAVLAEFTELDETERTARAALARLEAGVARRFLRAEVK